MTDPRSTASPRILVAINVAKAKHDVLVELSGGRRRKSAGITSTVSISRRDSSG